jgi:Glycosyl transferase family 2
MRGQAKTKQRSRSGGLRGTPTLDFAVVGAPLWVLGVLHGQAVLLVMAIATTILLVSQGGLRNGAFGAPWISTPVLRFLEALIAAGLLIWTAADLHVFDAANTLGVAAVLCTGTVLLSVGLLARIRRGTPGPAPASGVGARGASVSGTPRVSVVIPALDEAKNLEHVLPRLPANLHEVILVDGHSSDETVAVARRLRPSIRVLAQSGIGKGDALKTGFANVSGDIVVMLDADGSADPGEIRRFVDCLVDGADFAKGSRFVTGGGSSDITRLRHLGNWGLIRCVNLLYRTRYTDLCYGYNAFWTACLPYIAVDASGFEVETLINVRAAKAGLRIAEVPSYEADRIYGESHLQTFRDGFRVVKTIFRELPTSGGRSREQRPASQQVPARPERVRSPVA